MHDGTRIHDAANSIKVDINNSQMANCNMHERKNEGNNIVLNKINTSAALLDYKCSI